MPGPRDIEDICARCESRPQTHVFQDFTLSDKEHGANVELLRAIAAQLGTQGMVSEKDALALMRKRKRIVSKASLMHTYLESYPERNEALEQWLQSKQCRRVSGVTVVTVFLSPYPHGQPFSCAYDCAYCPNEPGQPRSYLFAEPGVLRANQNGFDCVKQMHSRMRTYKLLGHPVDKLEVLVLGGTIASYPKAYLEEFFRDIYYACNVFEGAAEGPTGGLEEEQLANEASSHRVIGLTVETRPDCVSPVELHDFRRWGVTRVQIGVQHTDDEILRKIQRRCLHKHTLRAAALLRNNGFKFDVHLMPNLPGSTPDKDRAMMDEVLAHLHPDQIKLYPTEVTPFTQILEDYKAGRYVPYSTAELMEVIIYWKTRVHPWIRNNRIIRDIPGDYIIDGVDSSNQRQDVHVVMAKRGLVCRCIRCREAGRHPSYKAEEGELVVRTYTAAEGTEHFISWESRDGVVLFGFVRLRLHHNPEAVVFPEIVGAALIRELHVYGNTVAVDTGKGNSKKGESQHLGVGRRLMQHAETMAYDAGFRRVAVISGNSVRNYYRKLGGYELEGTFMMKRLQAPKTPVWLHVLVGVAGITIPFLMACYIIMVANK